MSKPNENDHKIKDIKKYQTALSAPTSMSMLFKSKIKKKNYKRNQYQVWSDFYQRIKDILKSSWGVLISVSKYQMVSLSIWNWSSEEFYFGKNKELCWQEVIVAF